MDTAIEHPEATMNAWYTENIAATGQDTSGQDSRKKTYQPSF